MPLAKFSKFLFFGNFATNQRSLFNSCNYSCELLRGKRCSNKKRASAALALTRFCLLRVPFC